MFLSTTTHEESVKVIRKSGIIMLIRLKNYELVPITKSPEWVTEVDWQITLTQGVLNTQIRSVDFTIGLAYLVFSYHLLKTFGRENLVC